MKNTSGLQSYLFMVGVVLVVSGGLFVYLFTSVDATTRQAVKLEALKVLMQLAVIGIVGGFVTWFLNERSKEKERDFAQRQKEMDRQEVLNQFRRDAVARLVTATNIVRKAPILIESHRSKKTYGEQIRAILDAKLDIALLRHELESPHVFEKYTEIRVAIRKMESYVDGLISEWKKEYVDLPEPPHDAWGSLQNLKKLGDLIKGDETSDYYKYYLDGYREALRLMRADILNPTK